MFVNLFEIHINPAIDKLYVSDSSVVPQLKFDDLFINVSDESIITLDNKTNSRPIVNGIDNYNLWLIREYVFKQVEKSDLFYDFNKRDGSFSILSEKIHRDNYISILREIVLRFYYLNNRFYISVLPKISIQNRITLEKLLNNNNFDKEFFLSKNRALVYLQRDEFRGWYLGYIKSIAEVVKVEIPTLFNGTINVEKNRVIPKLSKKDYSFDKIYYQSLTKIIQSASKISAKETWLNTQLLVQKFVSQLFEKPFGQYKVSLNYLPLNVDNFKCFDLSANDAKLSYIFKRGGEVFSHNSRFQGLSKLNFSGNVIPYNVVLFGTKNTIGILDDLVDKLNNGTQKGNYRFDMPSKFGIKLNVVDRFITDDFNQYLDECNKFIFSAEENHKSALAIAYLPEHSNVYYEFKAKLAAYGKVSQIRSKPETDIYTAWNIAANIYAKIGYIPWSISENGNNNNADLVLGFSYSSLNVNGRLKRNIGYVNVYDKNGEWKFMRSHPGILDFENRHKIIPSLIQDALYSYMAGGSKPEIIDIHYSKKFSRRERKNVFESIIKLLPQIRRVNFISINDNHSLRLFDPLLNTFVLKRGRVVFLRDNEFILSVAGEADSFRQMYVIVHTEGEETNDENNLLIAERILAMTKLNWRSVVKESSEPVTLKYSNEIAKLTNYFNLTEWGVVSTNLSNIPWFI